MDLILWRHAEAEDGEPDHARALTARGIKQAAKMGRWLDANLPDACRIYASPTVRTLQTAERLGRKFKRLDALAPGGAVETILAAIRWPEGREPVLLIGHQPVLGELAAYLITGRPQAWTVRKANIWWIGQRDRESGTAAETPAVATAASGHFLRAVVGPDLVNNMPGR